jgi:ribonuclease HII
MHLPTFKLERELLDEGYCGIVGVDEAGAGALAGPLVAAAVILPTNSRLADVRDSKTLSDLQKDRLYDQIYNKARGCAVGIATVREIYKFGLRPANLLAMRRAIESIPHADFALIDAWNIPKLHVPQRSLIRGDQHVKSIAAASIIAKVTRDNIMIEHSEMFPEYKFDQHKGYGTKIHRDAIKEHGPCMLHRMKYKIFAT